MSDSQELQVQQKREVEKKTEGTTSGRVFLPVTDIFETPEALTVVLDFTKYEGMQPLYTEYNVGHYARSFQISNKIDQTKISALMKDGVVTIVLPKAEQAKPRKIQVS